LIGISTKWKKTSWFATMLKLAKKLCMLHKFDTDTGPSLVAYHPCGRFWHSSWELIGCKKPLGAQVVISFWRFMSPSCSTTYWMTVAT
jgi:hypothetical protein